MTHEMVACAIGARSQMARTYLERHLDEFPDCDRDRLIDHALRALKESLSQDRELTIDNTTVGVVGVGSEATKGKIDIFKLYDGQEVTAFLESANDATRTATEETGGESMEVDS
jgi:20S proteasome subunit alpha 6